MPDELFVCIHGHFYQPPRENPWLETVEVQDSAAPYHDWNERVTAECYAPNTVARSLDDGNGIVALRNNYKRISFNFGPTLLAWMERARPDVYAQILSADQDSARRFGRGNAIAQVYGHCIMPLASRRDQQTQVRWGIADFMHRFGRRPDGMWLPETAVDARTLTLLAEHGIRFTILAPSQAARVCYRDQHWAEVSGGAIDSARPYRCTVGCGLEMTIFFYDAALSHAIAFGGLLHDGRELARCLVANSARRPNGPHLSHVATDGESYGHHHGFGEMALAAALDTLERDGQVRLTNYAAYLDQVAVRDDVEVRNDTSWSCAHGVERWRTNCGCNSGGHPDWQQTWRTPLRHALDWLQTKVDALFEQYGDTLLCDPWAARDDYVSVCLQRDADNQKTFLERHAIDPPQGSTRSRLWKLMEMQRHMLLSFTSCGWFFDEPSGIETVQVLTYAARAIQLAGVFGADLESEFLHHLEPMRSNLRRYPNGRHLYGELVRPLVTDNARMVAHYAITSLFSEPEPEARVYAHRVDATDRTVEHAGNTTFAVGRGRLTSEVTQESAEYAYVALQLGAHDIHCAVTPSGAIADFAQLTASLRAAFFAEPLTELVRRIDGAFGGKFYTLRDVLATEQRRILAQLTARIAAEYTAAFQRTVDQHRRLLEFLAQGQSPLPEGLRAATTSAVQSRLEQVTAAFAAGTETAAAVRSAWTQATRWHVTPATDRVQQTLEHALEQAVAAIDGDAVERGTARAHAILDLAQALEITLNLWEAQNRYYALITAGTRRWPPSAVAEIRRLGERLSFRLREWDTLSTQAA
jgi:alpha-amylase/alpha-mannosidase (GH57 family)